MQETVENERLQRLKEARDVIVDLEEQMDCSMIEIRRELVGAGEHIKNEAIVEQAIEKAMARVAGIAIGEGYDEIVDRAVALGRDYDFDESDSN